jgi:23S rRNA (uracil1939-C5)-methyltransferase
MPDPIELRIEKLVYGGDGLGHHDGHTVFVPFVLPDETVSIDPLERKKKFIRGRVARIVQASPDRVSPRCPHFGTCGGCNYQHMPYELQVRAKTDILRETLSRLGRISWDGPVVPHLSPPFEYRNRAQWKIAQSAAGVTEIGYYEAGSQKLCPVRECPILSPLLSEALIAMSRLLATRNLSADLQEVEVFADADDQKLLLNLAFARLAGGHELIADMLRKEIPQVETILFQDRHADRFELSGPGHISYRVGDHNYRVGHLSFFQVNRFILPELVQTVIGDAKGRLALDLFAGVGLFTLPLAHRFERVIGVESNEAAARDLAANLQESGASSPAFRQTDAESFLARWTEAPDLVVLDPPRAGVASAALSRLANLAPAAIAYLSCDPATLARDLAVLVGTAEKPGRYLISEVHLVDIFPQTYHMEVLVRLVRRA